MRPKGSSPAGLAGFGVKAGEDGSWLATAGEDEGSFVTGASLPVPMLIARAITRESGTTATAAPILASDNRRRTAPPRTCPAARLASTTSTTTAADTIIRVRVSDNITAVSYTHLRAHE